MEPPLPTYTSLSREGKQIRLLRLPQRRQQCEDQTIEQEISCAFSVVSLEDAPVYEALSYVWGEPAKEKTILIDNEPVAVTRNLHDALSQLQSPDEERILWVDAVCINQDDNLERTHQVSIMRHIYEHAFRVLVYLGPAWVGCEEVFEFFEASASDPDIHYNENRSPHVVVKGKTVGESSELQGYLGAFFKLPWWERIWTVQEFVLAKIVILHCGPYTLPEKTLYKCHVHLSHHQRTCCGRLVLMQRKLPNLGQTITAQFVRYTTLNYHRTNYQRNTGSSFSFLYTISSFRTRHSYDSKDKVFGLLGLASGMWEGAIIPDYSQSTEDVYRDVMIACVERTGTVEFLNYCHQEGGRELPSFIPDWSVPIDEVLNTVYTGRIADMEFDPSNGAKAQMAFITPSQAIFKGLIFEKITQLGPPVFDSGAHKDFLLSLYEFSGIQYPTANNIEEATESELTFAMTMCGGINIVDLIRRPTTLEQDWPIFKKWVTWIALKDNSRYHEERYDEEVLFFHRAHMIASHERRLIKTETGRLGIAPRRTQEGDVIAILAGSDTPFVLRPQQTDDAAELTDQTYSLIGNAYIHSIMWGEAWPEDDSELPGVRMV